MTKKPPGKQKQVPGGAAGRFPRDEMSTGIGSSLRRKAAQISGAPDQPLDSNPKSGSFPALKAAGLSLSQSAPAAPARPADPKLDAEAVARQIRTLASTTAPPTDAKARPNKNAPPPPPPDTFVKSKMKQAETNLPDFDFEFPDDEDDA